MLKSLFFWENGSSTKTLQKIDKKWQQNFIQSPSRNSNNKLMESGEVIMDYLESNSPTQIADEWLENFSQE